MAPIPVRCPAQPNTKKRKRKSDPKSSILSKTILALKVIKLCNFYKTDQLNKKGRNVFKIRNMYNWPLVKCALNTACISCYVPHFAREFEGFS